MIADPAVIHESAARGDTRYPYAAWMPIPEQQTQPLIDPTQLIFHSMAGPSLTSLEALRAYMARDDVHIECTFASDLDARMSQHVDANRRADCNAKANIRAISVETQDRGSATLASTPWSPGQLEQHAGLAAWCHLRFGIPLALCPRWDAPGIGYHRLFPEWSVYVGKTCPGDARVAQFPALLARAVDIAAWSPASQPTPPTEDDVTYLSVDAPGRGGALVAIDGGGITMVGYASTDDRTKVDAALGAKPLAISAAQWDAWQAQAIWRAR